MEISQTHSRLIRLQAERFQAVELGVDEALTLTVVAGGPLHGSLPEAGEQEQDREREEDPQMRTPAGVHVVRWNHTWRGLIHREDERTPFGNREGPDSLCANLRRP